MGHPLAMILGVGVDMVVVSRIEAALKNPNFAARVFTPAEREEMKDSQSAAGLWAAKEAVIKAVGRKVRWQDIEVRSDARGKPLARLQDEEFSDARVHISITHDGGMAMAFAVLEA